ncbi:MAG: T9SS type A sorting domain-containing protein [Bacteroidota bacterium]
MLLKAPHTYTRGLLSCLLFITLSFYEISAQHSRWVTVDSMQIDPNSYQTRVYPRNRSLSQTRAASGSQAFVVDYNGFGVAAQTAFDYAIGIWSNELFGMVPINVEVSFANLPGATLATASANLIYSGSGSLPVPGAYYPSALINQYQGCDLAPATNDIAIVFNSNINWYFGTDLATPVIQYDFVSVALHELGHGLGFFGTGKFDDGIGAAECDGIANNGCIGLPVGAINYSGNYMVFDEFVANSAGNDINSFTNPSGNMGLQLTGDDLFWQGANGIVANGGMDPKLHVPITFQLGSSYSHLDENTYPAGNPHSLMTPALGAGEAIHDIGDVCRGMFQDMGWTLANIPQTRFEVRTVGYSGLVHEFTDASAQAVSWEWDFDNDGFIDATGKNPTHTYAAPGVYTASLTINGNPALTYTQNIEVYEVPLIPFVLDFDLSESGFYPSGASCDQWEWSDGTNKNSYKPSNFPVPQFGSHSWFTKANGNHGADGLYYLETMPFNFVGAVGDYFLDFEFRAALSPDAGMNMEYSTDGGLSWQILGPLGAADPDAINDWYDQTNIVSLNGEPGWAPPTTQAFNIFTPNFRINAVKGFADVRFRLKFGSGSSNFLDGFQVDNFEISGSVLNANSDLSLSGRQVDKQHELTWSSQTPAQSLKSFTLERALGNGDFIELKSFEAGQRSYRTTLANPLPGLNRYRVRQLAQNGSLQWSETVDLQHHSDQLARLYPNPASQSIWFEWYNPEATIAKIKLLNLNGQVVWQQNVSDQGLIQKELDIGELASGVYLYQILTAQASQRGKLVVQ